MQSYQVLRPVPVLLPVVLRVFFGVRDLRADLHQNLHTSIRRLAEVGARESDQPSTPAADG